jgi:hypothetical protein
MACIEVARCQLRVLVMRLTGELCGCMYAVSLGSDPYGVHNNNMVTFTGTTGPGSGFQIQSRPFSLVPDFQAFLAPVPHTSAHSQQPSARPQQPPFASSPTLRKQKRAPPQNQPLFTSVGKREVRWAQP